MANHSPPRRPDIADGPSPTVVAARLVASIILVATFAWGIWVSADAIRFCAAAGHALGLGALLLGGCRSGEKVTASCLPWRR